MKVLFATYPMAFHTPGGGEVQLLAYRDHLPQVDVDVTLLNPWDPQFLEHDVVHFFSCIGGSVHFCDFIKRLGKPLVITSSLWITEETRHQYPIDEIRAQLSLADKIITNSEMESDTLANVLNLDRQRFASVYNGVDAVFRIQPDPTLFRKAYGIHGRFVLNVGNIEPRKNQARLLQAMDALPDHELVLIGHVRDQAYFDAMMDSEQAGKVRYLGPIDHHSDTLRSAYQACDLFCLPSTLETPGLAALEAAMQGCRLVVTSEGSTREYFGESACYVSPLDVDSIRNGLKLTASASGQRYRADPQLMWDRFSWTKVVGKLRQVYEQVA